MKPIIPAFVRFVKRIFKRKNILVILHKFISFLNYIFQTRPTKRLQQEQETAEPDLPITKVRFCCHPITAVRFFCLLISISFFHYRCSIFLSPHFDQLFALPLFIILPLPYPITLCYFIFIDLLSISSA